MNVYCASHFHNQLFQIDDINELLPLRALPRLRVLAIRGSPLLAKILANRTNNSERSAGDEFDVRFSISKLLPSVAIIDDIKVADLIKQKSKRIQKSLAIQKLRRNRRAGRVRDAKSASYTQFQQHVPGGKGKQNLQPFPGSLEWLLQTTSFGERQCLHNDNQSQSSDQLPENACTVVQNESIVRLQARARGWIVRRKFARFVEMNAAAVKIQSRWRGFHDRKLHDSIVQSKGGMANDGSNHAHGLAIADLSRRLEILERTQDDQIKRELCQERRRRESLEVEHLKLEEAVRFLWKEVVALRNFNGLKEASLQQQDQQENLSNPLLLEDKDEV